MSETRHSYWDGDEWLAGVFVGRRVTGASKDTLTLDDGTMVKFDQENSDCCSWIELKRLATTDNVITAARFEDDEGEYGEGAYKAWLHVITEAGELNIAEAEGDASNGYYLHGFALGVTVMRPDGEAQS